MKDLAARLSLGSGVASSMLRVVVGVLLAWHGYRKFADDLDGFEGFLTFLDLPAPGLLAVVVALLELVGGIALAVGVLTRPVAALFVVEFALIFAWIKLGKLDAVLLEGTEQPGVEIDLLYLATAAYFLVAGPGPISVDSIIGIEPAAEEAERIPVTV